MVITNGYEDTTNGDRRERKRGGTNCYRRDNEKL